MKLANISSKKIEEITAATIQAYEKITELHTDLKEKSRRINLLEIDLAATQNDTLMLQQKYQDTEREKQDLEAENKKLSEKLYSDNETNAAQALKIKQLELILQQKDAKIKSQQASLDLKNVECNRLKKMSKKYAKTINTVSPQAVNNVRFVKKFPLLESRCNSLEEKLDQLERERDLLLSKLDGRQVLADVENSVATTLQYTSTTIPLSYSNYRLYSSKSYFTSPSHQEFAVSRAPLKRRSSQELLYDLERSKNKSAQSQNLVKEGC